MSGEETRLSILEEQRKTMAKDISELKDDLKDFKTKTQENFEGIREDLIELKLTIAKWAGAITVIVIVAQFIIGKLIENL